MRYCGGPVIGSRAVVTALATVGGTANGQPVSGRVWVGADYYNLSLRVESDSRTAFILTAERAVVQGDMSDGEGTLYLPGEQQIVRRASARALLEAVLGLPLTAQEFVSAFTGCGLTGGNLEARTLGTNAVRISMGNTVDLFLRRAGPQSPWTLFATSSESRGRAFRWRVEYEREQNDVLKSIRIRSEEANRAPGRLFDLDLSLSQIQFSPLVVSETFSPTFPPGIQSVSLEMVRRQRSGSSLPLLTAVR